MLATTTEADIFPHRHTATRFKLCIWKLNFLPCNTYCLFSASAEGSTFEQLCMYSQRPAEIKKPTQHMYALSLTQEIQGISHPHYKNFKVTVNAPTPNPRIVMDQLRHRNVNVTNAAGAIWHWSKITTAVGKSSGSEHYHPWNTVLAAGSWLTRSIQSHQDQ